MISVRAECAYPACEQCVIRLFLSFALLLSFCVSSSSSVSALSSFAPSLLLCVRILCEWRCVYCVCLFCVCALHVSIIT